MRKILTSLILFQIFFTLYGQDSFKDSRDGNVYRTITVQGMVWMAENLRYKSADGANYFDNNPNNVPHYGVLYDWVTANNVCPAGWHLPSGSEYRLLMTHYENEHPWRRKASDPTSFQIQLGGMKDYEGTFTEMDESGYYWTSTEYDKDYAEYFSFLVLTDNDVVDISRKEDIQDIHGSEKSSKYSVRCVKNQ